MQKRYYTKNKIFDSDTNKKFHLNSTGFDILQMCNGENTIYKIKKEIQKKYDGNYNKINKDVTVFLKLLHQNFLINYEARAQKISNVANFIAAKIWLFFQKRRYDIVGMNILSVFVQVLCSVFRHFLIYPLVCNLLLLILAIISYTSRNIEAINLTKVNLVWINIFFIGIISGIGIHEFIHLFIYRIKNKQKGFLGKYGISIALYRPNDNSSILLKLAPGSIVGSIGVLAILIINGLDIENKNELVIFFYTYAIHFSNLLPIWGDGKEIMKIILKKFNLNI